MFLNGHFLYTVFPSICFALSSIQKRKLFFNNNTNVGMVFLIETTHPHPHGRTVSLTLELLSTVWIIETEKFYSSKQMFSETQ
jgi:hypothetical protein